MNGCLGPFPTCQTIQIFFIESLIGSSLSSTICDEALIFQPRIQAYKNWHTNAMLPIQPDHIQVSNHVNDCSPIEYLLCYTRIYLPNSRMDNTASIHCHLP